MGTAGADHIIGTASGAVSGQVAVGKDITQIQILLNHDDPLSSLESQLHGLDPDDPKVAKLRSLVSTLVEAQLARVAEGAVNVRRDNQNASLLRRDQGGPRRVNGQRPPGFRDELLGRGPEQAIIGRWLADPECRLVTILGRGGIGKTALATKVLSDLSQGRWPHTDVETPVDGILYMSTRTDGITFDALYDRCTEMLGGDHHSQLKTRPGSLPLGMQIQALVDALGEGLYVILLDNMEDLLDEKGRLRDEDLRRFVATALTQWDRARFLVTSRQRLSLDGVMSYCQELDLEEGLPEAEAIEMLRQTDRGHRLDGASPATMRDLVRVAQRVPRALEVVAGILANNKLLSPADLIERFDDQEDVQTLIEEGYRRLDTPARRVLDVLSVFGRSVDPRAVEHVMVEFFPGLRVLDILNRLENTSIVTISTVEGQPRVALHPLDVACVYRAIPQEDEYTTRALERRAAEWYSQTAIPMDAWATYADLEEPLLEFHHLVRAREFESATARLLELGDPLMRHGYPSVVRRLCADVAGHLTDPKLEMWRLFIEAQAVAVLGDLDQAVVGFERAGSLARQLEDIRCRRQVLAYLGHAARTRGDPESCIALIGQALALDPGTQSTDERSEWLFTLGLAHIYAGDLRSGLERAHQTMDLANATNDDVARGRAHDTFSLAYLAGGDPESCLEHIDASVHIYERSHFASMGYLVNVRGLALVVLGNLEDARGVFDEARRLGRTTNSPGLEGRAAYNLAHVLRLTNDRSGALDLAREACQSFELVGSPELVAAVALARLLGVDGSRDAGKQKQALLTCARAALRNPDLFPAVALREEAESLGFGEDFASIVVEIDALAAAVRESRLVTGVSPTVEPPSNQEQRQPTKPIRSL